MKEWIGPGMILGGYEVVARLGDNHWNEVFLVRDETGAPAALKLLADNLVWEPASLQRFIHAIKAAPPLDHRNICRTFDAGATQRGRPYVVSELIHGRTLDDIDIGLSRTLAEKLELAIQLTEAVQAAHARGILHLGLTPSKVLVEYDRHVKDADWINEYEYSLNESKVAINFTGRVKVLDFVVMMAALGASVKREHFTLQPYTRVETLPYCCPEWVSGEKLTPQADIFSLGVVIYELLTGNLPFKGQNVEELRWSIFTDEPPPLTDFVPELSPTINQAVLKALAKDPADRFRTAEEFTLALRGLAQAETESELLKAAAEARAAQSFAARWRAFQTEAQYWLRGNWRRVVSGVIIVFEVFFIATILLQSRRNAPAPVAERQQEKVRLTPVTHQGQVREAVLAPDGLSVVYLIDEPTRQTILQRPIASATEEQESKGFWARKSTRSRPQPETLLATTKTGRLSGLVFAPDGMFVYYLSTAAVTASAPSSAASPAALPPTAPASGAQLLRVPVGGGRAQPVLAEITGPIGFAPERKQFAFMRQQGEITQLCLGNVSEPAVRVLAAWRAPAKPSTAAPAWAPDGKTLAYARRRAAAEDAFEVVGLEVASGAQRALSTGQWSDIYGLSWLPSTQALLVSGRARGAAGGRLWRITTGALAPLTQGLDDYRGLSLNADASRLLTVYTVIDEASAAATGKLRSDAVLLSGWER